MLKSPSVFKLSKFVLNKDDLPHFCGSGLIFATESTLAHTDSLGRTLKMTDQHLDFSIPLILVLSASVMEADGMCIFVPIIPFHVRQIMRCGLGMSASNQDSSSVHCMDSRVLFVYTIPFSVTCV